MLAALDEITCEYRRWKESPSLLIVVWTGQNGPKAKAGWFVGLLRVWWWRRWYRGGVHSMITAPDYHYQVLCDLSGAWERYQIGVSFFDVHGAQLLSNRKRCSSDDMCACWVSNSVELK
jgi:hypothetical protein